MHARTHACTHTLHMHTMVCKHLPSIPSTHTHTHTHTHTTNTSITNDRWKRRETTNQYAEETRWDFYSFHLNEYPTEKGREFQRKDLSPRVLQPILRTQKGGQSKEGRDKVTLRGMDELCHR